MGDSSDDGLSNKDSANVEDLAAVESSTNAEGHHGSLDEADPMISNPVQDLPSLPKQTQDDGQHEPTNADHAESVDSGFQSSSSFVHCSFNQSENDPPSNRTEQTRQNEAANEYCNQPDDSFDHSQSSHPEKDAPILPHQPNQAPPSELPNEDEQAGVQEGENEHQQHNCELSNVCTSIFSLLFQAKLRNVRLIWKWVNRAETNCSLSNIFAYSNRD